MAEKKAAVRTIGACKKCLGCHEVDADFRDTFFCKNRDCRKENGSDHHFFLCPRKESMSGGEKRSLKENSHDAHGSYSQRWAEDWNSG